MTTIRFDPSIITSHPNHKNIILKPRHKTTAVVPCWRPGLLRSAASNCVSSFSALPISPRQKSHPSAPIFSKVPVHLTSVSFSHTTTPS